MPEPSLFRHYQIVQNVDGSNVELARNDEQVNVLAFDTQQLEFVHCHVLLEALADRAGFEENCRKLQKAGHPLLARVSDFGEDEGNPFYITGNVDGESLQNYLARQTEIPSWLAVMLSCRALEAVAALAARADAMPWKPLDSLRLLQTGPQTIQVQVADFRVLTGVEKKVRGLKTAFEKQAKFLKNFLQEHSGGGPNLPDRPLPAADFTELLNACLDSAAPDSVTSMQSLLADLLKLVPETLSEEIPTAQKPRALLAQQLAGYQDVARAVVNRIRIQSQRLDMANPYSMRGILTKTGRAVLIEQVPPLGLASSAVQAADEKVFRLDKKHDFPAIVPVVLVHESEGLTCMVEELAEGITLSDLLRERCALNVHETYIVLAGLDGALSQLEKSGIDARRIRLEDVFLLTGFPREDARSMKLLLTKLTDWPTFSVMLRVHPTLASMAGRGTDPALVLPPLSSGATGSSLWDSAWLAAVGHFLLALEPLPGAISEVPASNRETETVTRLIDDELAKGRGSMSAKRGDFLTRYARVVEYLGLAKPAVAPASKPLEPAQSIDSRSRPLPTPKESKPSGPMPLTRGFESETEARPSIGFAELLFRGTSEISPASGPDWAKTASDAPPTINPNEALLPPDDFVPFWLRAAVFIGGSMIVGGALAHLSGDATWQKKTGPSRAPSLEARVLKVVSPPRANSVPKAVSVLDSMPAPTAPSPPTAPSAGGLGLKPPMSLKEEIVDLPPPAR